MGRNHYNDELHGDFTYGMRMGWPDNRLRLKWCDSVDASARKKPKATN